MQPQRADAGMPQNGNGAAESPPDLSVEPSLFVAHRRGDRLRAYRYARRPEARM